MEKPPIRRSQPITTTNVRGSKANAEDEILERIITLPDPEDEDIVFLIYVDCDGYEKETELTDETVST